MMENLLSFIGLSLIQFYRIFLSGFVGGNCRFYPSCSEYAQEAFSQHRPWVALKLTTKRLSRCYPLGKHGFDPVPDSKDKSR